MKQLILSLLLSVGALAQSVTIPAQKLTTYVNVNGKRWPFAITIPAQTLQLPSPLPTGLTWTPASGTAPGVLAVPGNVSANALLMTGGPPLPASANGLYVLQMQPSGFLTPVPLPEQSGLPTGLAFSNGVLTVQGSISATQISLTGGPTLPACASGLYLWQLPAGATALQPSCYTVPTLTGTAKGLSSK